MEVVTVFEEMALFDNVEYAILTEGHRIPLYGNIVHVSDDYLTVEKRNGKRVVVKKTTIKSIWETTNIGQYLLDDHINVSERSQ